MSNKERGAKNTFGTQGFKEKVASYWSQRADTFSAQRLREFSSNKHELWIEEFKKFIPMDRQCTILDLGTGTGFFSFLLASAGHRTVGIDLTKSMIEEAKKTASCLDIQAEFHVMDAEAPAFAPHSFDILVTRNLTWTLPHLEDAYNAWHKLLTPSGLLINFDADYCHEEKGRQATKAHKDISSTLMQQYENIKSELVEQQQLRPKWDKTLLEKVGFHDVSIDTAVWERIYPDTNDEFYNPTPIFMIAAYA